MILKSCTRHHEYKGFKFASHSPCSTTVLNHCFQTKAQTHFIFHICLPFQFLPHPPHVVRWSTCLIMTQNTSSLTSTLRSPLFLPQCIILLALVATAAAAKLGRLEDPSLIEEEVRIQKGTPGGYTGQEKIGAT